MTFPRTDSTSYSANPPPKSRLQKRFSMELDVYKEWLGIPEGDRPPDHYTLLRVVQFEDDEEKIRRNYTKLNTHVRKYATGKYSQQSQDLLNELAKAMLCLTDPERKREYDVGLGREFDEPAGGERMRLGEVLVAEEQITNEQRKEAESFAAARGLMMRDAVVQMKLVDAETATRAFAAELGYSFIKLEDATPDDSVLDKVPRNLVKRHSFLPLFVDDDVLLVACVHEPTPELEEELRLRYGVPMRPVLATPLAINQGISRYFAPGMRDEAVTGDGAGKKADRKQKQKQQPKPRPARKTNSSDLGPEELHRRKMMGILIMCWAVIGSVLIDQFVVKPLYWGDIPPEGFFAFVPFWITPLVAPLVIIWVVKFYWK
ncbi:MAG: hypothetical protein ACE5KM_14090 [Planctomycetaceae bacterium]